MERRTTDKKVACTPLMVMLRFKATRVEADVDGSFLANRSGSSLGAAEIRSLTDFHVTGCNQTTYGLVTTKASQFELPIDEAFYKVFETKKGNKNKTKYDIKIDDRLRVNTTVSRTGIAIDGSVVDFLSGQGSAPLRDIFSSQKDACSAAIPQQYASWLAYSAVINVSNVELINELTGKPFDRIVFTNDAEKDKRMEKAIKIMENKYLTGVKRRSVIRFEPVPELSKSVMKVPVGVSFSGYDLCVNVVDRPQPLSEVAFESMAIACLKAAMVFNEEAYNAFISDCSKGISVAASKAHANTACVAMSFMANALIPYRVDGMSTLMPSGLQTVSTESWKAEPGRSISTCDDCEGSGTFMTSALYRAHDIANDKDLAAQFPVTTAISNSLGHHVVGLSVLAANAGHAEAANTKAKALAGHAIAVAIPKPHMMNALAASALHSRSITMPDDDLYEHLDAIDDSKLLWTDCLYTPEDLARMHDPAEAAAFTSHQKISQHATDFQFLALEGTSPVSPAILHEPSVEKRWKVKKLINSDEIIADHIGPSVARKVVSLHVSDGDGHQFYDSLVELLLPLRKTPFFRSESAGIKNFLTAHFVFVNANDPKSAGAFPIKLAAGDFGLLPLWAASKEEGEILIEASEEVLSNTLPIRSHAAERLSKSKSESYKKNIQRLVALDAKLNRSNEGQQTLDYLLPFAALINNRESIEVLCDHIENVCSSPSTSAAMITMHDVVGLLEDDEGVDIGKFVMLSVSMNV